MYLPQQKCMMSVPVGVSVSRLFLYRRATAAKVSYLRKDQRRTAYIASTTTAVFRLCCGRLGTALTTVSPLRTLTRLAFVPAALVFPSSLESEGGVLMHRDCRCNSLCRLHHHKLQFGSFAEGLPLHHFPKTSRLTFRLLSTCILGVEGLQ